jgi:hypothetical protein
MMFEGFSLSNCFNEMACYTWPRRAEPGSPPADHLPLSYNCRASLDLSLLRLSSHFLRAGRTRRSRNCMLIQQDANAALWQQFCKPCDLRLYLRHSTCAIVFASRGSS